MAAQIFKAWSILLLSFLPGSQSARAIANTRWIDEQNLRVKLWTWNSLGADMTQAVHELFEEADADPNIKVVAACQTESNIPILDYVDDSRWIVVSHGEHWGYAGGVKSAQILTVLYRQTQHNKLRREPLWVGSRSDWEQRGKGMLKSWVTKDYLMPAAGIRGVVSADSELHMNSMTGKGGVSAMLDLEETEEFSQTSLALICGHLDSQSEDKRDDDFLKLLVDGTRRKDSINDRKLLWSHPSLLFDNGAQYGRKVDAMVILGDLNYRIRYEGANFHYDLKNDAEMAELIGGSMRNIAAIDDPLNPQGANPKAFVVDSPAGFGLECNQPHEKYLPTYKRSDFGACEELNDALQGQPEEGLTSHTLALVKKCYVGSMTDKWKLKESKKFLQMGWLDRMCWRAVDGSATDVQMLEERGWHHLTGSDHVAISATLNLFHPRTYCRAPGDTGGVSMERMESVPLPKDPAIFVPGESVKTLCASGFAVHAEEEHLKEVVCQEDGSFSSALPQCLRICGPPPHVANAAGVAVSRTPLAPGLEEEFEAPISGEMVSVDSLQLLEGDAIRVSCPMGSYLRAGQPHQFRCDKAGAWKAWTGSGYGQLPRYPLACLRYCGEPKLPAASRVKILANADGLKPEFLAGDVVHFACSGRKARLLGPESLTCSADTGDYGTLPECKTSCGAHPVVQHGSFTSVMPKGLNWTPPSTEVLEGVTLVYSCEEGYGLVGTGNLTCRSDGMFDAPAPLCFKTAFVSITGMTFEGMDEKHSAKIKIFPLKVLHGHFNKFHDYTVKFKFDLPFEKNLDFQIPVKDAMSSFVHVEICNENHFWVSSCKTVAISQLPTAQAAATRFSGLLHSYSVAQAQKQFEMTIPMDMEKAWFGNTKSASVVLKLELSLQ